MNNGIKDDKIVHYSHCQQVKQKNQRQNLKTKLKRYKVVPVVIMQHTMKAYGGQDT